MPNAVLKKGRVRMEKVWIKLSSSENNFWPNNNRNASPT